MLEIKNKRQGEYLLLGGAILGGGGGGSVEEGRKALEWALEVGPISINSPEKLPGETIVATVALVGPPSKKASYPKPEVFARAFQKLQANYPEEIPGVITNENGGYASVNGFCQAAAYGLKLIDCPCNGRAHPLGLMGGMGLHLNEDFLSWQAAVGPSDKELSFRGNIHRGSQMVIEMAESQGAMIAVARNPIELSYARSHGAPGALMQAYQLGYEVTEGIPQGGMEAAKIAVRFLRGNFIGPGKVEEVERNQRGGLDLGFIKISGLEIEVLFCNEFITLGTGENFRAIFPDLITMFDKKTGWPVGAEDIEKGQEVVVITVPQDRLILGAGAKDPELLKDLENILTHGLGKKIQLRRGEGQ